MILTDDYNLITTILTAGAEYIGIFTQLSPHSVLPFNPLTAGAIHIRFLHFLSAQYIYQLLNMLKIKSDINQQNLKFVDSDFVKSE